MKVTIFEAFPGRFEDRGGALGAVDMELLRSIRNGAQPKNAIRGHGHFYGDLWRYVRRRLNSWMSELANPNPNPNPNPHPTPLRSLTPLSVTHSAQPTAPSTTLTHSRPRLLAFQQVPVRRAPGGHRQVRTYRRRGSGREHGPALAGLGW
jgi:hypothetical protein